MPGSSHSEERPNLLTARSLPATNAHPDHSGGAAIVHVPALDGLRGLAIALVVAMHFGVGAGFPRHEPGAVSSWIERVCYIGWAGVDLFFVLSGFLITSILLASRDQPGYFRRFYARRALRIFPLYVTALVVALVVLPRLFPAQAPALLGDAPRAQVWLWTYTLNIANAFGWVVDVGVLGQMWSLAIEEQFYLAWPGLVWLLRPRRLLYLAGVLAVGALVLRVWWIAVDGTGAWPGPYRFTLTRIDALAIGAALAVAWRQPALASRLLPLARPLLALSAVVLVAWFAAAPRFYPDQPGVVTFGHSLLALGSAALIVLALRPSPPGWMTARPMRALGTYSYGIYVWHWFVQVPMVAYAADLHPAVFAATGVAVSLILGVVSYHVLERPFLQLKRGFGYATGPSRADVPVPVP
jgi:peptidoglycan/LPS O-acetylase OafA/YrhL